MNREAIANHYSKIKTDDLKGLAVGLVGELGVGKTAIVKDILKEISPEFEIQVHSPTFNLCNIYQIEDLRKAQELNLITLTSQVFISVAIKTITFWLLAIITSYVVLEH